jgi:hypothetical protein
LGLVFVLLGACSAGEETPEQFLRKMEGALAAGGEIAVVRGVTEALSGQSQPLWTSEAWYDIPNSSARTSLKKDPSARLDIQDERVELQVGQDVYESYPGSDDEVRRYRRDEVPACFTGEPALVIMALLCALGPLESRGGGQLHLAGVVDFEGRRARALVLEGADPGVSRLLVDAKTYLPIGHILTVQDTGFEIRTAYDVQFRDRDAAPGDFFDPRALGYSSPEEEWLAVLDDPALGVPVYWPGRSLTLPGVPQASLSRVEDRRSGSGPGMLITLTYSGREGMFRLDYWQRARWDDYQRLLGSGFVWSKCSDRRTLTAGNAEIVIFRGFEPTGRLLASPQLAGSPTQAPFDLFPGGCPEKDYDRFLAEVRFPEVTVTINAPYGLAGQSGGDFGAFDAVAALEAIARSLRPRQPGE